MSKLVLYAALSPNEIEDVAIVGYVPMDTPLHKNPKRLIDFFKLKSDGTISLAEVVCSHDDLKKGNGEFHFPAREGIAVSRYIPPNDITIFYTKTIKFNLD